MPRTKTKSFYIAQIVFAVLMGLVIPFEYLCDWQWDLVDFFVLHPRLPGILWVVISFLMTAGLSSIATLLFTHACMHLEVKGAHKEH